jgi:hypothetical protein
MVLPLPGSCGRAVAERPCHILAEVIKIDDQDPRLVEAVKLSRGAMAQGQPHGPIRRWARI